MSYPDIAATLGLVILKQRQPSLALAQAIASPLYYKRNDGSTDRELAEFLVEGLGELFHNMPELRTEFGIALENSNV